MDKYQEELMSLPGMGEVTVFRVPHLVIGSGAAGLNCAEHLADSGRAVAVMTRKLGGGTSRNSGSDKQTYYKMGIFGDAPDSPMEMAETLFAGGMMHGDHAYIEALGSLPEFFHLVRNGVPFPHNRYGAYVGYKTDHDPRQRATSAGPKTSAFMVEGFLKRLDALQVPIFDGRQLIRFLLAGDRVVGAVALNRKKVLAHESGLEVFLAQHIILATGGPGKLYRYSVFPGGQVGALGVALQAGAAANNLTEWQFGLASTAFRWNLSGSYQQVVPAYFSVDAQGGEHHFLNDYFADMAGQSTNIFLKGYQWPFHAPYLCGNGSSLVDLAVWEELSRDRQVFLDFRRNPQGNARVGEFSLDRLAPDALAYLQRSDSLGPTPFERLEKMNPDAIALYREHNIDLAVDPLACAVCAQHINGGLRVNEWWETSLENLFAIGEAAGTHGVRPGGSALNAGQTGGLRVAQRIGHQPVEMPPPLSDFDGTLVAQLTEAAALLKHYAGPDGDDPAEVIRSIQSRMSRSAAFIRQAETVGEALSEAAALRKKIGASGFRSSKSCDILTAFEAEELVWSSEAVLESLQFLLQRGGGSRGSYVILDAQGDLEARSAKGRHFSFRGENKALRGEVGEIRRARGGWTRQAVPVRPLPDDRSWYETEWRRFKSGKVFE